MSHEELIVLVRRQAGLISVQDRQISAMAGQVSELMEANEAQVVADTFTRRGHDYATVTWDSWRGESGKWIVQLHWHAGRSDNRAHWTFHPRAHGGTVTVLDDHAAGLIDPESGKPLRSVPVVTALGGQPASASPPMPTPTAPTAPDDADGPMDEEPAAEETLAALVASGLGR